MVQKYQSPVRVYKHPFEIVMAAYEKRFPTCKLIPVFLGSDITSEYKSEDGAIHIVERRCKLNVDAPYLLKKIIGVDHVIFIQKNSLDRRSRTLKIEAHNESFSSRVIINENCLYSVHPENPSWTCFEQDASLDIKSFFGFENSVEKIAMKQYTQNIKKGKHVMEHFIQELLDEGITYLPPWRDPNQSTPAIESASESDEISPRPRSRTDSSSGSSLQLGATAADIGDLRDELPSTSASAEQDIPEIELGKKLDDDYIRRFLGSLSPYQESRLIQLRTWLAETHKGKIPKDNVILRFLRARDFHIEKAREMLCHSLAWRKLHDIDRLVGSYQAPEVIRDYYAGGWHYADREGRPLYILRLGSMDVKGLIKSVGEDGILKHVLAVNEEGMRRTEQATKIMGHPVSTCTCIVDLDGLSMRHLWRPGIKALLRIIEVVEANYPETMGRLLIVRAPRVFPVLWTLISPFIDENTRQKFMIYGGSDYKEGLRDYVDQHYIPDFLEGDCYCDVPEGGLVPKSLYMPEMEGEDKSPDETPFGSDSIYKTAYLMKDYPHEVLIQVPQKGSVITWDFDILKGGLTFTVFHCKRTLTAEPHEHHVHGAVGGIGSTQYLDKHKMVVGKDLSIVQAPTVCHDGDSVQGSYVSSQSGSYVLQWKYFNSHEFEILSHKSKVMYHTEVLRGENFKGSMTSLQSSTSGFSSLSLNTTQSNHSKGAAASSSLPSR